MAEPAEPLLLAGFSFGGFVAAQLAQRLAQALQAALAVPTAELAAAAAREGLKGPQIGERIEAARVAAMAQALPPAV